MELIRGFVIRIFSIFFTVLIFSVIISTISFISELFSSKEKNVTNNDVKVLSFKFSNKHFWNDNYSRNHYGNFKVNNIDVNSSYKNKISKNPQTWKQLYNQIYFHDKNKLTEILNVYKSIYNSGNYNKKEFADIIISSVQYIPYILTVDGNCSILYKNDRDVRDMINDGIKCKSDIYAGLFTPLEFMKYFEGDCDTRTLFIFTILKHFGYDVKILNSDLYGHSIIGLNLPSRGSYKTFQGKRYYTWETTSKYWELGDIPPETSNMNYWYVEL